MDESFQLILYTQYLQQLLLQCWGTHIKSGMFSVCHKLSDVVGAGPLIVVTVQRFMDWYISRNTSAQEPQLSNTPV